MRTHYAPLFRIECLHGYFADGLCRPLSLRPTAECRRLLEQYRCLFKATPAGGTVAFAAEDGCDFLSLYAETTPFSFDLISADPGLLTYTDAAMAGDAASPAEQVYYFDNLGHAADDGEANERRLLHPARQALAAGPLPVRPRRFSQSIEKPAAGARLSVVDTLRGEPVWQSAPLTRDPHAVPLDLAALPDGRYRLQLKKKEVLAFYLSDVSAAGRWGVVDIFPGGPAMVDRVPEGCRVLDEAGRPLPKTFVIRLNNRSTIWRYYIVNPNPEDHSYDGHRVEEVARRTPKRAEQRGTPFTFTEVAPTRVAGQPARVFESTRPIALCERPGDEYEFMFRANGQAERGGRAFRLPYARGEATRLEEVSGARRMVSEIYVYL
jgi:hypothetical protein